MTTLEENSGSGGNSSIEELETRVENLESTTADQETRLTTAEANLEGIPGFFVTWMMVNIDLIAGLHLLEPFGNLLFFIEDKQVNRQAIF